MTAGRPRRQQLRGTIESQLRSSGAGGSGSNCAGGGPSSGGASPPGGRRSGLGHRAAPRPPAPARAARPPPPQAPSRPGAQPPQLRTPRRGTAAAPRRTRAGRRWRPPPAAPAPPAAARGQWQPGSMQAISSVQSSVALCVRRCLPGSRPSTAAQPTCTAVRPLKERYIMAACSGASAAERRWKSAGWVLRLQRGGEMTAGVWAGERVGEWAV